MAKKKSSNGKPLSLQPLNFKDALSGLLKVKPAAKPVATKTKRPSTSS